MPISVFGEGAGMIGGDHKDAGLWAGSPNDSFGSSTELFIRNDGIKIVMSGRWSIVGHIPANAIINSAVGCFTKSAGIAAAVLVKELYDCVTAFGVTPTDEGASASPAAASQPTYNRAFANPTNTPWAGGGAVTAADNGILSDTVNANGNDIIGTVYQYNFKPLVDLWKLNDANNNGYFIRRTDITAYYTRYHSQEAAVPANRPYLTIDWDLPPSTTTTHQSHTAIHAGIAMM